MYKPLLFKITLTAFLLLAFVGLKAQDNLVKPAFEFPTKEVYDMHVDKHGFLWIASDFGVSRFDGINCVHFSHPKQISLGCTNLQEDNYGRIWFNNFNGQIFYIENEKVTLLEDYHYKNERNFPRLVVFHDQLLATSDKGLFVLDTKTLKGKYLAKGTFTANLSLMQNQVLIYGNKLWYSYNEASGIKKLAYKGDAEPDGNVYLLASNTYRDTAYMMINPAGIVKKLVLQNDTVKQVKQIAFNGFINTLSISADNQWVNTGSYSYSLKNGEKITGHNLSCIVTDLEGNKWYGSVYYGLLIQYKKDIADKTIIPGLDNDDLVVSVRNYQGKLLLGTQKGFLILYDPASKAVSFKMKIAPTGSIYFIAAIDKDNYIIASSINTYRMNIPSKKVTELVDVKTAKALSNDDKATYIAATSGLYVIPHEKSERLNQQIADAFGHVFKYDAVNNYFYIRLRSRAIAYFPDEAALYVTFKTALYKIDKNGMKPFLFNNEQVYAASLSYMDHRLHIGTISNGMLIIEKNNIKHISVQNGLFSKSIFKIKPIDKNLWILGTGPLQLFNTETGMLTNNYGFPDRSASEVFDLDGLGPKIYFATPSGLDNFPLQKPTAEKKLKNYLLYVKVNNKIATGDSSRKLPYSENNIVFDIGIPTYKKSQEVYIRYCLATKTDSAWQTTEPGERAIHFSSLMPGRYTLKAIAIDPRLGTADSMITYNFRIEAPWWGSLAFKIMLGFVFLCFVFYGYVFMLLKRLSLKKAFDTQQQLILTERQRISSEMHDEIGSGVFAIQNLADKASKSEHAAPEVDEIKSMVKDLSVKIREVIWSTSVGNDNLQNLLYYTYFQVNKLFEHSDIDFESELPDEIPDLTITGLSRRNIYLLVKELVHNAIKHSKATTIELQMTTDAQTLYLAVNDNGVGIVEKNNKSDGSGMGLGNIKSRVEKLNGALTIENKDGAHISIKIPFSALQVLEFDKKLNKWQLFITGLLKRHPDEQEDK